MQKTPVFTKENLRKINNANINESHISEINYYLFLTTHLQWINCDRFLSGQKTDYLVKMDSSVESSAPISFPSHKFNSKR